MFFLDNGNPDKSSNFNSSLNIIYQSNQSEKKLTYDIAVIQYITSCHKNRMTTCVITLWRKQVTSFTTSMSTMHFLVEIMFILKKIKSHLRGPHDKQNLTYMVISYSIY